MLMNALYGKQQVRRRRPLFHHFFSRFLRKLKGEKGEKGRVEQSGQESFKQEVSAKPVRARFRLTLKKKFILQIASLLVLFTAILLAYLDVPLKWHALPSIETVEDSRLEQDLLSYVSHDNANQGSGGFMIPENAIISAVSSREYLLKQGDTLSEIAHINGLDVGTLIAFNEIRDVRRIYAGTAIRIPNVDGVPYTVKKGDSLASIADKHNVHLNAILDANDLQSEIISSGQVLFIPGGQLNEYDYKKAMGTLFVYPTRGRLTSPFGYRNDPFTGVRTMHYGIDLAAPLGTNIVTTMAGTVVAVGDRPTGYGKYVVERPLFPISPIFCPW